MREPQTLALLTLAATLTLLPWVTGVVHVVCQSSWYGGFHGEVRFNINQTLTDWQVHIVIEVPVDHIETWDSNVQKISDYDFLVTPKDYDRVVNPGETLSVSFNGVTPGADLNPAICAYIVGYDEDWVCPRDGITAPPTPATTVVDFDGWGPWTDWTTCTVSCGGGTRSSSRACLDPDPSQWAVTTCFGQSYAVRACNAQACPIPAQTTTTPVITTVDPDAGWGPWSSWTACSQSCGGGTRSHSRFCRNPDPSQWAYTTCFGQSYEVQSCNTQACHFLEHTTTTHTTTASTTTTHTTTASTTTPVTTTVDPCLSLTCRPGHCVVHAGLAVCDCSGTGYTGTHCKINPCDSYDCGPGLCERHGTPSAYAVCDCSGTGFTGNHCQYQISIVGRASS